MFGTLIGKGTYDSDSECMNSIEDSHHNSSISNQIRGTAFGRRESRIRETKVQRVASLIEDAYNEEIEPRTRDKPEYKNARFVIFPDDSVKIFWDVAIFV